MLCHCSNCTSAGSPYPIHHRHAIYWGIDECLTEDLQAALAYDMSDYEVAIDLGWMPLSAECLQYWYESGEGYEAIDENIKWWKRQI